VPLECGGLPAAGKQATALRSELDRPV